MVFMLPLVLKNLLHKPATRPYPTEGRPPFPGARGKLTNKAATCMLCGRCARVCPAQCIRVRRTEGLWEYDPFACVFCGLCAAGCPTGSLRQLEERGEVTTRRETVVLEIPPENLKRKPQASGDEKPPMA